MYKIIPSIPSALMTPRGELQIAELQPSVSQNEWHMVTLPDFTKFSSFAERYKYEWKQIKGFDVQGPAI